LLDGVPGPRLSTHRLTATVRRMPTAAGAALAQIDAFLDDQEHAQERGLVPAELVTRGLAAIDRAAPRSVYADQARATVGQRAGMALHGVVTAARALRHDIAGGHVRPLEEIVHAEVFEDFLDMAAELLQGGYASSAAVLAGSE
jgi:hypothetical protein